MGPRVRHDRLPRHPAIWWSRIKLRWPFLVWLAAVAAALWLYERGGRLATLRGFVEAAHEEIASLEAGRLVECRVEIGQRVSEGDVVAVLDGALIEARLVLERLQVRRQFDAAIRRAEEELRSVRRRQLQERAELAVLDTELATMDDLVRRRLLDAQATVGLRVRQAVLAAAVREHRDEVRTLEETLRDLHAAKSAAESGLTGSVGGLPQDVAASDSSSGDPPGWFELRREELVLRARSEGVVARVHAQPGSVVAAGSPVVTLLLDTPARVLAFLPEWEPQEIAVGQVLHIARAGGGSLLQGRVAAISPDVAALPARASPVPNRTVRGRRFIVDVDHPAPDLIPGEAVYLSAQLPWWRTFPARKDRVPGPVLGEAAPGEAP